MRRKLVALGALLAGALAGRAILRRLNAAPRDHVDVYYADGSQVTLTDAESVPLLEITRSALRAHA
jgi:hypothetical protein